MQIGCFLDGALGEVFLDAAKQNSALDAFAAGDRSFTDE